MNAVEGLFRLEGKASTPRESRRAPSSFPCLPLNYAPLN
jgi:hypothetical protein